MRLFAVPPRQSRPGGYSSEEAEVSASITKGKNDVHRRQSEKEGRHRQNRHAEDEYHQAAQRFYETPSSSSVVVETVYRRKQVFADLHQFDEVPEIDTVPTAVGFHSMDSAEDIVTARSNASRYEMDDAPVLKPDPSTGSDKHEGSNALSGTEEEEDQETLNEYLRYGPMREDAASANGGTLRSVHSDDSDSCPPIWKSESQEENRDRTWIMEEAKRVRALNSVKVPKKILQDYETSQIVRQPVVETDEQSSVTGTNLSRAFRKLVGGSVPARNKYTHNPLLYAQNQPSKVVSPPATHGKTTETKNPRPSPSHSSKSKKDPPTTKKMESHVRSLKTRETEEEKSSHSNKSGSRHSKQSIPARPKVPEITNKERIKKEQKKEEHPESKTAPPVVLTKKAESTFSLDESKQSETKSDVSSFATPMPAFVAATSNNDDLIRAVRSEEDHDDADDETTNMERNEEVSLPETTTTIQGNGFTDWIINGFDSLANIGLNQPMFGFFDWSGEEKMIAQLENKTTQKNDVKGVGTEFSGKKMPPKTKLTKRLLSKEEIQARLMQEHQRRQQQDRERARERLDPRDPLQGVVKPGRSRRSHDEEDVPYLLPSRPETPISVEVKSLTLDEGGEERQRPHQSIPKKSSFTDSRQQRPPPPTREKSGLTIEFPTPSFALSNNEGSEDHDDASVSILGLERTKPEKASFDQHSSSESKKSKKSQKDQKTSKKSLFGKFRRNTTK